MTYTTFEILGQLKDAISKDFGDFDNFKSQLSALAVGIQGSGWAWLGYNSKSKSLALASCANQDPLQATTGNVFWFDDVPIFEKVKLHSFSDTSIPPFRYTNLMSVSQLKIEIKSLESSYELDKI